MKSTAQGNLQIVSDRLIFCYDVANPKSYPKPPNALELRNLARIDDFILPESGSTAVIDLNVGYTTEYGGTLICNDTGFIQFPGFGDISNSSYTIEFVISPDTLNDTTPADENYIIKSDDAEALVIKYGDDSSQIRFGNNVSTNSYATGMQPDGSVYQFVLTYDAIGDDYVIYLGNTIEISAKRGGLWTTIHYPFKIGYNFETFKLYQFRIYNKVLSTDEIQINREQFRRRYGNQLA